MYVHIHSSTCTCTHFLSTSLLEHKVTMTILHVWLRDINVSYEDIVRLTRLCKLIESQ